MFVHIYTQIHMYVYANVILQAAMYTHLGM